MIGSGLLYKGKRPIPSLAVVLKVFAAQDEAARVGLRASAGWLALPPSDAGNVQGMQNWYICPYDTSAQPNSCPAATMQWIWRQKMPPTKTTCIQSYKTVFQGRMISHRFLKAESKFHPKEVSS